MKIWLGLLNIFLIVIFYLVLLDKFLWSVNRGDYKLSRFEFEYVNKFCFNMEEDIGCICIYLFL